MSIYKGNRVAGTYPLYGTTGESIAGPMTQGYTDLQIKAIGVELRANDFFRGATLDNIRIVDAIGALLGYTSADMDYLFEHKELPATEE